jgi:hypothetical protein
MFDTRGTELTYDKAPTFTAIEMCKWLAPGAEVLFLLGKMYVRIKSLVADQEETSIFTKRGIQRKTHVKSQ